MKKLRVSYILVVAVLAAVVSGCTSRTYWGVEGEVPGGPAYYAGQGYRGAPPHHGSKDYKRWQKMQRQHAKQEARAQRKHARMQAKAQRMHAKQEARAQRKHARQEAKARREHSRRK